MMKAMRLLESTIWGGWENVPLKTKREIENAEIAREIVIERNEETLIREMIGSIERI